MKHLFLFMVLPVILLCDIACAQTWTSLGFSSPSTSGAFTPNIVIDRSNNVYIAFADAWDDKLSVMKYDGSDWAIVGSTAFSAGPISNCGSGIPMAIDLAGTPYVAYPDTGLAKATVMKFDGTAWVPVGNTCFSAGQAVGLNIAIDNSGTPYVVYTDMDTASPGAAVMKYNGSTWVTVGSTNLSAGYANFTSIAIAPDNTPYIAFGNLSDSGKATVMKYNGTDWVTVGGGGLSSGYTLFTTIAIDGSGTPYVAYEDDGLGDQAVVMKYNGSNWVSVGTGISAAAVGSIALALDSSGTPYVSFSDDANGQKATVMKYNGSAWVAVGSPGFSAGVVTSVPIAIDRNGSPYVTYTDTSLTNADVMKFEATTGIKNVANSPASFITVFPDPSHGAFTFNISSASKQQVNMAITNIAGEVVKELALTTNEATTIQLDVPAGTYFLSAVVGGTKVNKGIVVE